MFKWLESKKEWTISGVSRKSGKEKGGSRWILYGCNRRIVEEIKYVYKKGINDSAC